MGLDIECFKCGAGLSEQGALLFSPPTSNGIVTKHHFCTDCYVIIRGIIE